jgi:hypothetical protein
MEKGGEFIWTFAGRNIAGRSLEELVRQQRSVGGIGAGEIVPEEGVQPLVPDGRS